MMKSVLLPLLLCLFSAVGPVLSEVVVLDTSNFEHLTQASTGQTTGKWFVKFYAPWCGEFAYIFLPFYLSELIVSLYDAPLKSIT